MCFRCIFVLFYCLTTLLPPTYQTRGNIDSYRHIPENINSELAQKVVNIISDAVTNRKRDDQEQNMYLPELAAPQIDGDETMAEDPAQTKEDAIFPSDTPEQKVEYYSDGEEENGREEVDQSQDAISVYYEESTPINAFDAARPVIQQRGADPEVKREKLRVVPEIDIDNIAERVKEKLEKYFITTPKGEIVVTENSQRANTHKSSQRQIQMKKKQQPPTTGNNDDIFYDDVTETKANNNNENSKEDIVYDEYPLGKESLINNNHNTLLNATTTQEQYKQEQVNENTEETYANNKNRNKPVANNNQRQHIQQKMLKKAPNLDHNGNGKQKHRKNKKRQKTHDNSNRGKANNKNINRQGAQANDNNERPAEYANNDNEEQQTSVNYENAQNSYKTDENVQEPFIRDKDVTYAIIKNDDQQAHNNENVQNAYPNNANVQEPNINNNDNQETIEHNKLKQMTTNGHKRKNKRHNKTRQSNSNRTYHAQGYRQLNLPHIYRNGPQNLETTNSQYMVLAEQTQVPPKSIRKKPKMRPHQQPDVKRPAQMVKEMPIQNGDNEELLMVGVPLSGKNGEDLYNDYQIPDKDGTIFDSHEASSGIGNKAMPVKRKAKQTTPFKLETKDLSFDSKEEAKSPKIFKMTSFPTRETFSIYRPDFPDKMPIIAVNYNFSEPIPEKDRVDDNKTYVIPPAMVNGKISLF